MNVSTTPNEQSKLNRDWQIFLKVINNYNSNCKFCGDKTLEWIEAIKIVTNPHLTFKDFFHLSVYVRSLPCIFGPDIYQTVKEAKYQLQTTNKN